MICRCGPRSHARVFTADAVGTRVQTKRSDPTGTLPLQKRFQRELTSRWDTLRRTVPNFVATRTDLVTTISHASITGQDPVRAFQKWFDTAVKMVVVGDGRWMARFVREAGDAALLRTSTLQRVSDAGFDEDQHPRDKDGKWTVSNAEGQKYDVSLNKDNDFWYYNLHKEDKKVGEAIIASPQSYTRQNVGNYVGSVDIDKAHRGKGLASALYSEIERHQNIKLTPSPGWQTPAGRALWEKRKNVRDAAPRAQLDRIPPLQTLAHTELQGIAEAVSQQAVRAYANGLLSRQTPSEIARQVQQIIDKVGKIRARMLVSFITVRAFSAVTLDAYRAVGLTHVGIDPERVTLAPTLTRDAKKGSKSKSKGSSSPDDLDLVEVLTAGDNDVCQECEDISEDGPYTLDEAEDLIPAHPNCRCAFVPWGDERYADVHAEDAFDPDQIRDDHGRWASVGGLGSWQPPSDNNWRDVPGQNHKIYEPALPDLKTSWQYKHPVTGELKTVHGEKRLSSGVIMREPDGRTWLVKPKNGFGGYNYTFPKGGVEPDLSPQANAIKETYEESGLKARITGWAGDYHGDTSVTRMYHAVREAGHPKDHGWETESVTLVQPHEVNNYLNRSRDRKIAAHHIKDEYTEELHPRDKDGKWTSAGASAFSKTLKEGDIPHEIVHATAEGVVVKIKKEHDLPSLEGTAKSHGDFMHKGVGVAGKYYTFAATKEGGDGIKSGELLSGHSDVPTPNYETPIGMQHMKKIAGKMGSNEGGVYEAADGGKFYIKTPKTQDHVQNELLAAKLYQLAGVRTMDYVPVEGGNHVATVLKPLDKNNIAHFTPAERTEAQKDFATHAWLANWDAAGTGGDNQVIVNGKVHTVDVGGSLKYRAQGEPKGDAFGDKVTEINTLRDPSKSPDAAALYGKMTDKQLIASMSVVTNISNIGIHKTVNASSVIGKAELAKKLIARRDDIEKQMDALQQKVNEKSWESPPSPMAAVAHVVKDIPEHEFAKLSSADKVKHLLMKGTTTNELKSKLGWKSIGIPANAAALNLKLEKTQQNGVAFYKGTPMTAAEIATAKGEAKAAKAAKKSGAAAAEPKPEPTKTPFETGKPFVTAAGHDINTPIGSFKQSLEEHGVTYHEGTGNSHSDYIDVHQQHWAKAEEVAKWHPAVTKLSPETYAIAKNGTPTPEPAKFTAAKNDLGTASGMFKQSLDNKGVTYSVQETATGHFITLSKATDVSEASNTASMHPTVEKLSAHEYYVPKPATPEQLQAQAAYKAGLLVTKPPPAIVHPPATAAELTKAQKNVALQLQYVPGAPDVPEAHELISEFNKKYAGKTLSSPEELQTKVNAFKDLTAAMVPLQSVQQQEAAAKQAGLVAKAKEHAAKVAAKEAYEAANLHTLPDEAQREFWLKKTAGSNYLTAGAEAVNKYKYLSEHGVSPAEVGFIKAFTGSYSGVNENLRKGHMEEKEFAFKHIMQDALDKMPKHDGSAVYRKMTLDAAEIANYVPGQISEWKAFNSTSKSKDTWSGNAHFTILNPKSGVDVQKISSHPSEAEVIMPANTFYKVISKTPNTDVHGHTSKNTTHIVMEEIVPFTKKKKVA